MGMFISFIKGHGDGGTLITRSRARGSYLIPSNDEKMRDKGD